MTPVAHFLKRAHESRELARLGRDIYLSRSLLELAHELEAEAAMLASGVTRDRRASPRMGITGAVAVLRPVMYPQRAIVGRLLDISRDGARLAVAAHMETGAEVILELPAGAFHIAARIARAIPSEVGVAFEPDANAQAAAKAAISYFVAEHAAFAGTLSPAGEPLVSHRPHDPAPCGLPRAT